GSRRSCTRAPSWRARRTRASRCSCSRSRTTTRGAARPFRRASSFSVSPRPSARPRCRASGCQLPATRTQSRMLASARRFIERIVSQPRAPGLVETVPRPPPYPPYNSAVSVAEHRKEGVTGVGCAVLTISDTRKLETDVSGRTIVELLEGAGHVVAKRQILRDDPKDVRAAVLGQLGGVDAIVTTGGTGITSRDSTYEAIAGLLEKRLDGFGELFRSLSYQEIGSAAIMTPAAPGVPPRTPLFILPGSEHAVRLGMTQLILPELGHVVR